MKTSFFLYVKRSGSFRTTKNRARANVDELAFEVQVDIPDKNFADRVIPKVSVVVPAFIPTEAPQISIDMREAAS